MISKPKNSHISRLPTSYVPLRSNWDKEENYWRETHLSKEDETFLLRKYYMTYLP